MDAHELEKVKEKYGVYFASTVEKMNNSQMSFPIRLRISYEIFDLWGIKVVVFCGDVLRAPMSTAREAVAMPV